MKISRISVILFLAMSVIFSLAKVGKAAPLGTAFTYQGHLYDNNGVANNLYDFQFKLYNDPNVVIAQQIGFAVNVPNMNVIDGYFTAELDFGSGVFDGNGRWLEIGVRPGVENDPCAYTALSPLQEVTPSPYALYAKTAGADNDWTISGNDIYSINSGEVGIGTSTPSYQLHTVDSSLNNDAPAIYGEHAVMDYYGIGVKGVGLFKGVEGRVSAAGSSTYYGVSGLAGTGSGGGTTYGVYGYASGAATNYGVYGRNDNSGSGVYGLNNSGNYGYLGDSNYGVYGKNSSSGNFGYLGSSSYGVYGFSDSSYGVYGNNYPSGNFGYLGDNDYGVYGKNILSGSYGYLGGNGIGVQGVSSNGNRGLLGTEFNAVFGQNVNSGNYGYIGGTNFGVYGRSNSGYGIHGRSNSGYAGYFEGNVYVTGNVSALSFTDRTPYPKDLATAYRAVMSMERLGDGQYMVNDKETQLDHSKLSNFISSGDGNRDLSATVSCLNEVIKDLIKQNDELRKRVDVLEKSHLRGEG